ncbi:MAG: 16S rRNA (uracil(1498)-N(3))-methyltransferase, partial [Cyanobacteria bacterium P01_H01_bin.119]
MVQLQRITLEQAQSVGTDLALTSAQHHYLCRVLRLRPGDRFWVSNGAGQQWQAQLGPKPATAQILPNDLPNQGPDQAIKAIAPPITLMAALPKGNGFDQVVRQATEIGVGQMMPVISDRTLLRPSEQKLSRWRRIAAEAAEQSERLIVPEIAEPLTFGEALAQRPKDEAGLICAARADGRPLRHYLSQHDWERSLVLAVGPEGGWTQNEIKVAIAVGYQPVGLGRGILRAVTAPLVGLAL